MSYTTVHNTPEKETSPGKAARGYLYASVVKMNYLMFILNTTGFLTGN